MILVLIWQTLMCDGKRKSRKGLQDGTFAVIIFSYILIDILSIILIP